MLLINQLIALCLRLTGWKQYCCCGSYGNCQLSTVLSTLASTRLIRISNAVGAFHFTIFLKGKDLWGQVDGRSLAPDKNNDKEQHTMWEVNDAPVMA
ncbi:hypothetical protein Peur_010684 [Populus x canadensis]